MISEKFYVGYTDINRNYELSNVALLKMFQNLVTMHGKIANDSLKGNEHTWFLTSYHVKINQRPEYENWFNLSSWSRAIKGFIASREFEVKDDAGNLQISALSNWVRINIEKQNIERVSPELVAAYGQEEQTNFDSPWNAKLQPCEKVDFEKIVHIDRNFIDIHNHVNNVSYLELAYNVLPNDVFNSFDCREFEIMYKQAIKSDEDVCAEFTAENDFYNITIKSKDKSVLHAIVRLYK